MKQEWKYGKLLVDAMVALALSCIVNMSFFLFAAELINRKVPMPFPEGYAAVQISFIFIISFIAVTIMTNRKLEYWKQVLITVAVMIVFYFLAPFNTRDGEWMLLMQSRRLIKPNQMLSTSFVLVASLLYGKIYELIYQKQRILIENEHLINENLQTRYNMLANQISPHFLFNSLNSLSLLVREDEKDKALHYIEKLSDTFRYMLQTGQKEMITLSNELHFTDAYIYLHTIRYEQKLFCDIDVEPRYLSWKLPSMSLQPLIENAVKHNSMTKASPLHISIRTEDGNLIVSNPIIPKIGVEKGTGIGIKNLSSRYELLTSQAIKVVNDGKTFTVVLPLTK